MIPRDIPIRKSDIEASWHHIPSKLLPEDWSRRWSEYLHSWLFLSGPGHSGSYDLGTTDIELLTDYGIIPRIKGVMYRPREFSLCILGIKPRTAGLVTLTRRVGYYHNKVVKFKTRDVHTSRVPSPRLLPPFLQLSAAP